ncbi:16S rRNA (cytosine(1402)-N(4))-methyltransferase RsmH [Ornithinicoccus halotolerans]|uniref:16S rRNA (cytosine(1402)-N(4))-methyltransferase RsmH n=1 Tax=Ornithinicoccus halotolerans TaxID=1748220 RepID=UPI001297FFF2|nr:16S rRNA (cytosine(1402)-N(4))-methyltransferase RsmH [Ornithinicoccus halotolerans]
MGSSDPAERHVPVLRDRVVGLLAPVLSGEQGETGGGDTGDAGGPVHLDGTLGLGGHAEAVLERYPRARVVGLDRDAEALALAAQRLARFGDRFTGVHARYDELADVLDELGVDRLAGALFDLGVSSLQLDEAARGFAYRVDAPLDMRMDQQQGPTAADVLNGYDEEELTRLLRDYGEERFARRIARAVVRRREREPFSTSGPLVELLHDVVPAASRRTGGHPAKRTFQALRIEVNAELASWRAALPAALGRLATGGRIVVLSYHSLEDRITKRALAAGATSSAPPDLPVELPEHQPWLRLLTRGAEQADMAEVEANPRAASVRLRAAERTRETGPEPPPAARTSRQPRRGHHDHSHHSHHSHQSHHSQESRR